MQLNNIKLNRKILVLILENIYLCSTYKKITIVDILLLLYLFPYKRLKQVNSFSVINKITYNILFTNFSA